MKIEIKNLSKKYDNQYALDEVNLEFENGMYGLLGANGAGKTTLIKILAGIKSKTSGQIFYDGKEIRNKSELRKLIGYIPQKFSFYPEMTVFEIMNYFSVLNKIKASKNSILELLHMVHLDDKIYSKTRELSGGMMQRLGIAVALIGSPKLLLVDEPTVGLDPMERLNFCNILVEFSRNRTILFSSHIVSDIESTCNSLAILKAGKVIYSGTKDELIKSCYGMVWNVHTMNEENIDFERKYCVTQKNISEKENFLRIVSKEKPTQDANSSIANLNDAYIYKMLN